MKRLGCIGECMIELWDQGLRAPGRRRRGGAIVNAA